MAACYPQRTSVEEGQPLSLGRALQKPLPGPSSRGCGPHSAAAGDHQHRQTREGRPDGTTHPPGTSRLPLRTVKVLLPPTWQLHAPAKLSKQVQPLQLQPRPRDDLRAGTKCRVTGWGATDPEVLSLSDTLREVTVTVISRKLCNSPSYYNRQPVITKGLVCAGDARGQKDSCQVRAAPGRRPGRRCAPRRRGLLAAPHRGAQRAESLVLQPLSVPAHALGLSPLRVNESYGHPPTCVRRDTRPPLLPLMGVLGVSILGKGPGMGVTLPAQAPYVRERRAVVCFWNPLTDSPKGTAATRFQILFPGGVGT